MDDPVRKFLMRSWSPMRCMMLPTIFVSKKCRGNFISLARKSDISEMKMRAFTCSNIQLRMNSTDSCRQNPLAIFPFVVYMANPNVLK